MTDADAFADADIDIDAELLELTEILAGVSERLARLLSRRAAAPPTEPQSA